MHVHGNRGAVAALGAALAAAVLSACAPMAQTPGAPEAPPVPQMSESQLRERARGDLRRGIEDYELGQFESAVRYLTAALDHGQLSRPDQGRARKYLAFIHCTSGRETRCREEFRKALEIHPDFDLSAAEAGHPGWGPVYRDVRVRMSAASVPPAPAPAPLPAPVKREDPPRNGGPRTGAEALLDEGLARYEAGDYAGAHRLLTDAAKKGLKTRAEQISALKHSAFSLCLIGKRTPCRSEFAKIFVIEPEFNLAPAEAGHPMWGKIFVNARQQAMAERKKARRAD